MGQESSKPMIEKPVTGCGLSQVPSAGSNTVLKANKGSQIEVNRNRHESRQENCFANRTYDVIEPPMQEQRIFGELRVNVIPKEAKEHIYESIDNIVCTRNNSCQTEDFTKLFKESGCQTDERESRRNKKRNSDTQKEDMATVGKVKESRLSSDSSSSTQDSQGSADSGHFSSRNLDKSPQSPSPYLWQPDGLNQDEVKSFMNSLPREKVPSIMSPEGVVHFNTQLAYQNPKHDSDPSLCKHLTNDQAISLKYLYMMLLEGRGTGFIKISEDNASSCDGCGKMFKKNDMIVSAGQGLRHPSCFSCTVCQQFLHKLIYYSDDNNRLFCGRHYAELFKPRCFDCDELIVSGKFIQAMNHKYHGEHFRCGKCERVIAESKYTIQDDSAVCLSCHTRLFADDCQGCRKKITLGQKRMTYGGKHWHEECFICEKCDGTLLLGAFSSGDEKMVCGKCHKEKKTKMCCTCGEEIKSGSQLIEHDGLFYHNDCFCCKNCRKVIRSNFMENEGAFYCPACHRNLFSEKCTQCGLAVLGNGVTYNSQIWHDSCFGCYNCQQPLSSRTFLIRYGNRYCGACYEDIFAKQCHRCGKKITDGAFLTTNDLHWHNDCFKCADCDKDLRHVGFHMVNEKTYCSECPSSVYLYK